MQLLCILQQYSSTDVVLRGTFTLTINITFLYILFHYSDVLLATSIADAAGTTISTATNMQATPRQSFSLRTDRPSESIRQTLSVV